MGKIMIINLVCWNIYVGGGGFFLLLSTTAGLRALLPTPKDDEIFFCVCSLVSRRMLFKQGAGVPF